MRQPADSESDPNLFERALEQYLASLRDGDARRQAIADFPEQAGDLRDYFALEDQLSLLKGEGRPAGADAVEPNIEEPLGDFDLLEQIGRGGMGAVYRALQRSLGRVVAVKLLVGGPLADAEAAERFSAEARTLARLRHPNIVSIYEVGESQGRQYFSMELIDGQDLGRSLLNYAGNSKSIAECVKTLAETVAFAHQQGVLHRDLKPSNVLLDAQGRPHITDFGLAKDLVAREEMTLTGQVLGTPGYLSPEQAAGKSSAEIGPTVDVYGLGAILYAMIAGRAPFRGATPSDTIWQVIHQEAPRPRLLNAQVPADLETICLKCLEKEPARRYPSAQALADELQRFLTGLPILAQPISSVERLRRWCVRNRAKALLILFSVLLLLTFSIGGPLVAMRESTLRDAAETAQRQARSAEQATRLTLKRLQAANRAQAEAQVDTLLNARFDQITALLWDMKGSSGEVLPILRERLSRSSEPDRLRLHAALAALEQDPESLILLRSALLAVGPTYKDGEEFYAVRQILDEDKQTIADCWKVLENVREPPARRLRAARALALYDPENRRWSPEIARVVMQELVRVPMEWRAQWSDVAGMTQEHMRPALMELFRRGSPTDQRAALEILVGVSGYQPENSLELLLNVPPDEAGILARIAENNPKLVGELRDLLQPEMAARRQQRANAAIALLVLGAHYDVWNQIQDGGDAVLREDLIRRSRDFLNYTGDLTYLLDPASGSDRSMRRAIVLFLAECTEAEAQQLSNAATPLAETLETVYRNDPDSGVHSALRCVLSRWEKADKLAAIDAKLATESPAKDRNWHVDFLGQTMMIVRGPIRLHRGMDLAEPFQRGAWLPQSSLILRTFAIGDREVTLAQFEPFARERGLSKYFEELPDVAQPDWPASSVTWHEAALFCNWLSERAKIPQGEWCYRELPGLRAEAKQDVLTCRGYRLPTEAEWEQSCRDGDQREHVLGADLSDLLRYAVSVENSEVRQNPVGLRLPNSLGLFDILGNVQEWCHDDRKANVQLGRSEEMGDFELDAGRGAFGASRGVRGGSFISEIEVLRATTREALAPDDRDDTTGFRVVQTLETHAIEEAEPTAILHSDNHRRAGQ